MTVLETANQSLLDSLSSQVGFAMEQMDKNILALKEVNSDLARQVEDTEDRFDDLANEFQEACIKVLALHQPVARDLVYVMGLYKAGQDIERIGSLMARVGRKIRKIIKEGGGHHWPLASRKHFELMGRAMDALGSLVRWAGASPDLVYLREIEVESSLLKKTVRVGVEEKLLKSPELSRELMLIQGVSRHLDRAIKLVVSIAEDWHTSPTV